MLSADEFIEPSEITFSLPEIFFFFADFAIIIRSEKMKMTQDYDIISKKKKKMSSPEVLIGL